MVQPTRVVGALQGVNTFGLTHIEPERGEYIAGELASFEVVSAGQGLGFAFEDLHTQVI